MFRSIHMLYPFVADERSFRLNISECYLFVRIQIQTILRLKIKTNMYIIWDAWQLMQIVNF